MNRYLLLVFVFFLCGCLLTHKDINKGLDRSDPELKKDWLDQDEVDSELTNEKEPTEIKTQKEQKKKKRDVRIGNVSIMGKISQIDTSLRELRGQIETMNKNQEDRSAQLEQGLLTLIQTLDLRVAALAEEIKNIKSKDTKAKEEKKDDPEVLFQKAEKLFEKEQWKAAIISYEKYREKNRKGKFYKSATFQIGLCFQKLGMYKETKVFFREVWESFPNSVEAKRAKGLLSKQPQSK